MGQGTESWKYLLMSFYRLLAAGQQEIEVVVLVVVGTKLQNSSEFAVVGSRNSIKHHSSSSSSMHSMNSMCSMNSAVAACTLQYFSSINSAGNSIRPHSSSSMHSKNLLLRINTSNLLFSLFREMIFHIWCTLPIISIKLITTSDLLYLSNFPNSTSTSPNFM